jgi:sugar phosphate isomerase/epimerase
MRTLTSAILLIVGISGMVKAECPTAHPITDPYEDWRLGVQTWSFHTFTLFEAIDKTRSLGLDWIQVFPGQRISEELNTGFNQDLSALDRQKVKAKLNDAGIHVFALGVVGIPTDEFNARKLFEFAKDMGIETIATEPEFDQFDLIDRLAQEYKIKIAIHNHPKPSKYWDPNTVLKACQGRSKWIGSCSDVGHWVRSGLDPVQCLKKLQGRTLDVHIKEINDGHDVIWGTGVGRMKGILTELNRQNYKGTFSIEYEYNWENSVPEIRECVAFFDAFRGSLKQTGWKRVFDANLSNAEFKPNSWAVEDGAITRKGGGDIGTKAEYKNFVLDFEFKLDKNTNSGIFLRMQDRNWLPWAEVQILDSNGLPLSKEVCGAIFDIKEPAVNAVKPAGQWNRMTIWADHSKICVVLNNKQVINIDLKDWKDAHKNPDGTKNKFNIAYKDLPQKGYIGFQNHGSPVWYRNIKIKEL